MKEEERERQVAQLKQESARYYFSDPDKAMRIAQQARALGVGSSRSSTRALGIWAVATASLYLDRWGDAVSLYDQAGALYRAVGDELTVAHMHTSLVWALAYAGDPERALQVASHIEPVLRQRADTDAQSAISLYRLLNNLGIAYDVIGQPDRALDAYDRALGIAERSGDLAKVAQTHINRALALYGLNLTEEAEHAFGLTRAMLRQHTPDDAANFVLVDLNLGILHAQHGRIDRALAALGSAEEALRAMEGADPQLLTVRTYAAIVKTMSEDIGLIHAGRERLLGLWPEISMRLPRFEQGLTQLRLSASALRLGEPDQARAAAQSALELASGSAGAAFRWHAWFALARVALQSGDAHAAGAHLDAAIRELETLEEEVKVDTLRASFLSDKLDAYHTLIELNLTQGDKAHALRRGLLARASAPLALQRLREQAPEQAKAVEALRTKLGQMYRHMRLAQVKAQSNDVLGLGDPAADPAAAQAEDVAAVERQLRDALRAAGRIYGQNPVDLAAWPAELLGQQLQPGELLIEFVWTARRLWALAADDSGHLSAHALGETQSIQRLCEQYRAAIDRAVGLHASPARERLASALLRDIRAIGGALWASLLQPLAEQRASFGACTTLVIAPDGPLNQIPFHALPDATGRPVLFDHAVRYIASAAFTQKTVRKRVRQCVGISGAMEHERSAEGEFAAMRSVFPTSRTFWHADIAPETLIELSNGCDFLHLSTHASVHPYEPTLTTFAVGGRDMTIGELDRMQLREACVVLSACETLRGWRAGADVFSLGRSFIAAGAATLVTSLWRIAADATAEQLAGFYAALQAGRSVMEALRQTQLQWLESAKGALTHPAFWAPLVTFGADMVFETGDLFTGKRDDR